MTDKFQESSEFSFRTFDIYRRFVEVLQCKPAYLEEFKTGSPTEETCIAMIKRVFQSQQHKEEIKKYIQYFANHAKMMADHAEKLPDNWNDAIQYTDKYIKEIRKYLRRKGISIKSGLNSVEEIAKDIGKHIHNNPTVKQIEAIRYYLKYDLRNPKKSVISSNTPKKSKSKSDKASKNFVKSKPQIINDKIVEEQKVVIIQKENDLSLSPYETTQEAPLFLQINNEKDYNNDEVIEPPLQCENIETEIIDDLFEMTDLISAPQYKTDMYSSDMFNYEGNVMSPELNQSNSYVKIENSSTAERVEATGRIFPTFKTDTINSSSTEFKTINEDKSPSYNFHLKRKSSSPYEGDHYYGLKKQLQLCRRIPNTVPQKQTMTPIQAVHIKSNSDNSSDSEINIGNDNEGEPISRFLMMNQFEESNESEGKSSFDSEISEQMKNSIFNLKSKVRDMSYADAVKHIDLATTFCELKNAITQEELLIMQQIRDKMYFKSLNERSTT